MPMEKYKKNKPKKIIKYIPESLQKKDSENSYNWDSKSINFSEYYNDKRWRKLKDYIKRIEPICLFCPAVGVEIHHIIPAIENKDLFFVINNLAHLCEDCHKKVHAAYKRGISADTLFPEDVRLKYKGTY